MHSLFKHSELYARKPRLETSFDGPWVRLCSGTMLFPDLGTHLEWAELLSILEWS